MQQFMLCIYITEITFRKVRRLIILQEIVLKRAADLAEALYSMPSRGRSPPMSNNAMASYNVYASQLSSTEHDPTNGQWKDGMVPLNWSTVSTCIIIVINFNFFMNMCKLHVELCVSKILVG